MAGGVMPAALEKFQSATPRVRIELADLSSREINELANEGRLDLVISPGISVTKGIPGFQWTELRRLQPVLVIPEAHLLAKLKRIPPVRLRSEEHTSELQSHLNLVCRLLLEKKKKL